MKRKLILFFAFVAGFVSGVAISVFLFSKVMEDHVAARSRFFDECRLYQYSTNAFSAYLNQPPQVGIFALQFHLSELDDRAKRGRKTMVFMDHQDIDWMRAIAHVRLANLYAKIGETNAFSVHMDAASRVLSDMRLRVRGIATRNDLVRHVEEADRKGSFW
ncbi:MAG: hypothetical protein QOJ40_1938 [Verrucomicrobiota bacterium]